MEKKTYYAMIDVKDELPEMNKPVSCFHEDSGNIFASYRTNDCNTGVEKWQDGAMPTHWLKPQEGFLLSQRQLENLVSDAVLWAANHESTFPSEADIKTYVENLLNKS